ncbi:MAG TPA: cysteine desulfurase family protein [Bacteroidales bacterium]|nr:cysteine desulfurase family protein [Bacteroidales bacterium]
MKGIYLDNAATTPTDPRVIEAMMPYFTQIYGNASSMHTYGTRSKEALENSRAKIASYIGCQPDELLFTSSGSESNNMALKGIAFANRNKGNHIIVSAIEHDCILNTCKWLEEEGFSITLVPVDSYGTLDLQALERAIKPETILVSVMYANNEIGTIQPIAEIGAICRKHNILFHSDACQSFGKLPIDVVKSNIDLLTINAHKIYGPKGIGALYVRKNTRITPILHGGGQENGLRSSTENIAVIVCFAKAAELAIKDMDNENIKLFTLQKSIIDDLSENMEGFYLNGHPNNRIPGHLSFSFQGLEGDTIRLLLMLDEMGIAVSAGSACSSNHGGDGTSHVLKAIGLNQFEARGAIRVSMGRYTTDSDIEIFKKTIKQKVLQLNSIFSH